MPGKESKNLTSYSTSLLCEPTEIDSMDSTYDYIGAGKGLAISAWRTSTHEGLGTISNRVIPTHGRTRRKPPQQPPIAKPARSMYLLPLECWKVKQSKQGTTKVRGSRSYPMARWGDSSWTGKQERKKSLRRFKALYAERSYRQRLKR